MGTALESADDRDDKKLIQEMVDEADKNPDRSRRLQRALGNAIQEIIFKGQDIAPVRNKVKAAIAKKVKADVVSLYNDWKKRVKQWEDGGKTGPEPEWPFPVPK